MKEFIDNLIHMTQGELLVEYWWLYLIMLIVLFFVLIIKNKKNIIPFNFIKPLFCNRPHHVPLLRYSGICKLGYVCKYCGYEWYENRVRAKPDLKAVDKN